MNAVYLNYALFCQKCFSCSEHLTNVTLLNLQDEAIQIQSNFEFYASNHGSLFSGHFLLTTPPGVDDDKFFFLFVACFFVLSWIFLDVLYFCYIVN